MNEKPGLEPGFFARRAAGGLTGYALLPVPRTCRCYDLCHACRFGTFDNFSVCPQPNRRLLLTPVLTHSTLLEASPFFGGSTTVLGRISKLIRRHDSDGSSERGASGMGRYC